MDQTLTVVALLTAVLFGVACVHWGYAAYGAFAAMSLYILLGRFPGGRVWWILAGTALIGLAYARLDRPDLPPLRRAVAAVLAVSAVALYVAVNRFSLDQRWIEELEDAFFGGRGRVGGRLRSSPRSRPRWCRSSFSPGACARAARC